MNPDYIFIAIVVGFVIFWDAARRSFNLLYKKLGQIEEKLDAIISEKKKE